MASNEYIRAQSVKEHYGGRLLSKSGVQAVMTTVIDGKPAILVLATRSVILPLSIDVVPIYVKIVPQIKPLVQRRFKIRPVPAGVAIKPAGDLSLGTLGLVLNKGGNKYILSCQHVIGMMMDENYNLVNAPSEHPIIQPPTSTLREEELDDIVANLYQPIPVENTNVDAALAKASEPCKLIEHIYELKSTGTSKLLSDMVSIPSIDTIITKSGQTTGVTCGKVASTDASIELDYGKGKIALHDLIMIENIDGNCFSTSGDSGSAVIEPDGHFCGLLFAGDGEDTFVCKAANILSVIGEGYSFVPHLQATISEPLIPGVPYEAPIPISPGSLESPGGLIDTLSPTLEWQPALPEHWGPGSQYILKLRIKSINGSWGTAWTSYTAVGDREYTEKVLHFELIANREYAWVIQTMSKNGVESPLSDSMFFKTPAGQLAHALTIKVSPVAGGYTTPEVGTHSFVEGETVLVASYPNTGYRFKHWEVL